MDNFITSFGDVMDLDDPETYRQDRWETDKRVCDLRKWLWEEIGISLVYMDYLHPGDYFGQRERVVEWAKDFAENFWTACEDNTENRLWWRKRVYRFLDEIENQC